MVKVNVKWGKETFSDVEIDATASVEILKLQMYSLTRVPPERQKILGIPGGPLKDDDDLSKRNIKEGTKVMLIGTAEEAELKEPAEKVKFEEDMTPEEIAKALQLQTKAPLPVGLENLGNTCYMNSCVQMLRRIPELEAALEKVSGGGDVDTQLAHEFNQLLKAMKGTTEAVKPVRFLLALRAKVPSFAERGPQGMPQQQDAEECIRNMLAAFAAATPEGDTNSIDKLFAFKSRSVYKCVECDDEPEKVDVSSDRFLMCHMGATTDPVGHVREGIKLSLKENVEKSSEILGRVATFEKSMAIESLPTYMIVQFARFGWKKANSEAGTQASKVKIGRKVQFPKKMDVYEFCTPELQKELGENRQKDSEQKDKDWDIAQKALKEGKNLEVPDDNDASVQFVDTGAFELQSVVSHQGRSADGGHYVGWTIDKKADGKKVKEDEWLLFDDDKVSERPDKAVDLAGGRLDTHIAYFVLYKKAPAKITVDGKALGGSAQSSAPGEAAGADKDKMEVDG
jgi:ubiquitin carboxyl-terminal hydrolase 14